MSWIVSQLDRTVSVPDLLDEAGHLRLMDASDYDRLPRDGVRYWCQRNARYGLPTRELIAWLKEYIAGRSAIEVGAGAGDLAHWLGIRATDSKMQADSSVSLMYRMMGQPPITYPDWVEKLEAVEAVRKYKPQVVVAQWVTHWIDPNLPPPPGGGCMFGIKEEELLAEGVTYIVVANRRIHGTKPILKLPHKELQLPFIRSRATYPEDDLIYIWEPK